MSVPGLGCAKTQRHSDGVEWAFHQASYLVVETSRACSVAIDFGKLFSSSFDFSRFYTARVNRYRSAPLSTRATDIAGPPHFRPHALQARRQLTGLHQARINPHLAACW